MIEFTDSQLAAVDIDSERARFEDWLFSVGCQVDSFKTAGGLVLYRTVATQVVWRGWLARAIAGVAQ